MGMRSPEGAAAPAKATRSETEEVRRPPLLTLAAAVLAVEAVGLCVAAVLTAADTAAGRSSQASSGVALTVLEFILIAGLAWIASGVARVRPWSRTPAVMIQAFTAVVAIYLLQAHRFDWGVPALLFAAAGAAALLAPVSWRALTRQGN
jgi:cytochrome bd-type quinol oxidase subunit 2